MYYVYIFLEEKQQTIIDQTETNLVTLRRTIYLTIQSSIGAEECAHKLLKMNLRPGQEVGFISLPNIYSILI